MKMIIPQACLLKDNYIEGTRSIFPVSVHLTATKKKHTYSAFITKLYLTCHDNIPVCDSKRLLALLDGAFFWGFFVAQNGECF